MIRFVFILLLFCAGCSGNWIEKGYGSASPTKVVHADPSKASTILPPTNTVSGETVVKRAMAQAIAQTLAANPYRVSNQAANQTATIPSPHIITWTEVCQQPGQVTGLRFVYDMTSTNWIELCRYACGANTNYFYTNFDTAPVEFYRAYTEIDTNLIL